jgi:membrane associated rhomboid family serine protease
MNPLQPRGFNVLPIGVKNIIIINVIFFFATWSFSYGQHINLNSILGLFYPGHPNFKPYQFITYMFMHGDISHLAMNMLSLWFLGSIMEQVWGLQRFIVYYVVCGLGAALCHLGIMYYQSYQLHEAANAFFANPSYAQFTHFIYSNKVDLNTSLVQNSWGSFIQTWANDPSNTNLLANGKQYVQEYISNFYVFDARFSSGMIGASGAVYGILFAYGYLFPNTLLYVYFLVPIKAKYLVAILGAVEIFLAWKYVPGDNIAHIAHLGGMLVGFVLLLIWKKTIKKSLF